MVWLRSDGETIVVVHITASRSCVNVVFMKITIICKVKRISLVGDDHDFYCYCELNENHIDKGDIQFVIYHNFRLLFLTGGLRSWIMDARQTSSSYESYSDALKIAVNALHLSILQHGPYDIPPVWKLSLPMAVVCKWPKGEVWKYAGKRLYLLDTAALSRLRSAMKKLAVIDQGMAWPHVNLATEPAAVEWLMFRDNTEMSSDTDLFITSMKWIVLSPEVGDLMDYIATLHNLAPTTATITLRLQGGVSLLPRSVEAVPLTSIIVRPQGIIASFLQSPHSNARDNILSHSQCIQTVCIADKDSVESTNCKLPMICVDMKYHCVIEQLPSYLQSLIADTQHYGVEDSGLKRNVPDIDQLPEIEITIKEEPLAIDEIDSEQKSTFGDCALKTPRNSFNSMLERVGPFQICFSKERLEEDSKLNLHEFSGEAFVHRQSRGQSKKHFGRLLECPKCSASFKFGLHGIGLSLLLGHIYSHHSRLVSHCRSILQRRYADILEGKKL